MNRNMFNKFNIKNLMYYLIKYSFCFSCFVIFEYNQLLI